MSDGDPLAMDTPETPDDSHEGAEPTTSTSPPGSGLPTRTFTLVEERDRLDEALDQLADKLFEADAGTASAAALKQTANDIETQLGGVAYLIDEHGADATVTVEALRAGTFARVEDKVDDMRAQHDGPSNLPGARSNVFAAAGLRDAPFLEGDDADTLDGRTRTVANQPVGVAKWLEAKVNELTTAGEGDFRRLRERLVARRED